jgi:RNA polymerase-binding transcription factor DksA
MANGVGTKSPSLDDCWKALLSKREELTERLYAYRSHRIADREGDEEAGVEHQAPIRELACVNMENDIRTLAEVELSLDRLRIGKYGRCGSCGGKIPTTRLMAIPWTHVCVDCAGGGFRQQKRAFER